MSNPPSTPASPTETTYARARLRLGMTGVGLLVVLATWALVAGWPRASLPTEAVEPGAAARALTAVFALYALLQVPLDLLGGFILPKRYGRNVAAATPTALRWVRGVVVQGAVVVGSGVAILAVAASSGALAAWVTAIGLMVLLVAVQGPVARLVGSFGRSVEAPSALVERTSRAVGRPVRVDLWVAHDEGFTGGWFGLPGRETLVLPAHWAQELSRDELEAVAVRRAGAVATGARARGLFVALAFNGLGLALASQLPGAGFDSVAALVTTALGVTLWSFVGVLVLPSISRPAVVSADAFARRQGVPTGALSRAIRRLDRWQDDEPGRTPVVETIFHPVPSVERRLAAVEASDSARGGAWHAARMMLFLSWSGLGFLARAVHCNAGRPQLWVALPAD